MRLRGILRFVGFSSLALLLTGLAQECTESSDCVNSGENTCCGLDGVCSVGGTLAYAADATDACQCKDAVLAEGHGVCGCSEDSHCTGNFIEVCCKEQALCQLRETETLPLGAFSITNCECESHVKPVESPLCATCVSNSDCFSGEICCPAEGKCKLDDSGGSSGATGDPHMTGFLGQSFEFTGVDGTWYALVSEPPRMHLNMRVTAPIPAVPTVTYITGLSLLATDFDGTEHTIVILVKDPHSMDSTCQAEAAPCLADASLNVVVDGEEALVAPGTVVAGPGIQVTAVNIPGECRSFGFEDYWAAKQEQVSVQVGRKLSERLSMEDWILADPTVTNRVECMEYVTRSLENEGGLFVHQSEHATFQIITPAATIRLNHGRLHELPGRDATDQFNLPDYMTWQMNMAIDHTDVTHEATGVLGETFVPTRDAGGDIIMHGMEAIRGEHQDYAVAGPMGMSFTLDGRAS